MLRRQIPKTQYLSGRKRYWHNRRELIKMSKDAVILTGNAEILAGYAREITGGDVFLIETVK